MSGETWAAWGIEQRTAAIAAVLLIVSTFGPFSFVEAALILVAGGVLWLLKVRGDGKGFELPFGDGTLLAAAGTWSAILIITRVFDRPLGQNLLALSCAGLLTLAGLLQRAQRTCDAAPQPATPPPPPTPSAPHPAPVHDAPPPAAAATGPPAHTGPVPAVHWLNGEPAANGTPASDLIRER